MPFNVYPDDATAALLGKPAGAPIMLVPTEAMRSFVPLATHVGPDPAQGNVPTSFIRIAVSGDPLLPIRQPKIELLAHDPSKPDGSPAPPLDPNSAISLGTAVTLLDNVNVTGAALAYFSPPFLDNVYLLKVVIEIPETRLWIRITNAADDDSNLSFVWVIADNDADSRQPWIHATHEGTAPVDIKFNVSIGQTAAQTLQPIKITNFGTGPFTVSGVTPAFAAPYTISGLPVTLGPNPGSSATVTVGFNVPSTPGNIPAAVFSFVTTNKTDPGPFGRLGHNNQFILSAHTSSNIIWAAKAPMPTARFGLGLAAAGNGKLYAVGGQFTTGKTVEEYDPATDTWTNKAPMPTARIGLGLAAASNGRLYAIGGNDQLLHFLAVVEEYNPATNTWSAKALMPTARSRLGLGAAGNGKLYAVGGSKFHANQNPPVSLATVEEYDPAANMWATKANMPSARDGLGLAAAPNGKLYAVGGFASGLGQMVATVEEYDPTTNTWTTKAPMPTARAGLGLAAASNGKLYAIGGGSDLVHTANEEGTL